MKRKTIDLASFRIFWQICIPRYLPGGEKHEEKKTMRTWYKKWIEKIKKTAIFQKMSQLGKVQYILFFSPQLWQKGKNLTFSSKISTCEEKDKSVIAKEDKITTFTQFFLFFPQLILLSISSFVWIFRENLGIQWLKSHSGTPVLSCEVNIYNYPGFLLKRIRRCYSTFISSDRWLKNTYCWCRRLNLNDRRGGG